MNGDLISREVTLNILKERYCEGCTYYGVRCKSVLNGNCPIYNAIIAVDAVPAVDAEPVRHGKWTNVCEMLPPEYHDKKRCSVCANFSLHDRLGRVRTSYYCPTCGAKMDADECTQIES